MELKDKQGRMLTLGLFKETATAVGINPPYTLKEHDIEGYKSMYQEYMNCVDEYEVAMHLLGSMRHWEKLCSCNWFMNGIEQLGFPGLEVWRKDKEAKDQSIGKKALMQLASEGNTQAAKILYEGKAATKGRPKKEDIAKAARDKVNESSELEDIWNKYTAIQEKDK